MSLSLLPSLKDPKLFSVRCKIGNEREAAVSLMNKHFTMRGTKDELNIFSASALDKFPGYIFIEAHRDFHVKEAIKGLKILNISRVKPIPVKEVTQVFTPDASRNTNIEPGQFARIKSGLYAGDLVIVEEIDEGSKRIKIKLVPRLATDSSSNTEAMEEVKTRGKAGQGAAEKRPPQKLFNDKEYPEAQSIDNGSKSLKIYHYKGHRFENGLLSKLVMMNTLDFKDVIPSLEEIQMFQKGELRKDVSDRIMERARRTIEESKLAIKNLQKGDKVKIIQGDLKGITGQVIEVTEEHIKVMPDLEISKEPISFLPNELTKLFIPGDNVEILTGKYKGITGMIAKVDGNVAHVISQDNKDDMQVLVTNIKYSTSVNASQRDNNTLSVRLMNARNNVQKHDLIILNDNKTVGVITSVLKDSVAMIDSEGYTKTVPKIQVLNKLNPQGHTKNSYNQDIYPRCIVRVNEGLHKGRSAVVKHVYNDTLFLYDQNHNQNSGIFVERVNNCYLLGSTVYDNTKMMARFNNPNLSKVQNEVSDAAMPASSLVEEKRQVRARQDPKTRRVNLIGQTKAISKGAYKGFSGMIQSLTGDMVKIELQAMNRCITVPLDYLNIDPIERESYSSNLRNLLFIQFWARLRFTSLQIRLSTSILQHTIQLINCLINSYRVKCYLSLVFN